MEAHAPFARYISRLESFMERGTSADLSFASLARELFALQYQHIPLYADFCRHRGVVPSDTLDWRDIPALPTGAFRDFEITSLTPPAQISHFESSGTTTQRRSRSFHDLASLKLYEKSVRLGFAPHFPDAAEFRAVSLTPAPKIVPHSSLAHMMSCLPATRGVTHVGFCAPDGRWLVDVDAAAHTLCDQNDPSPRLLLGTAFGFVQLCDALAERGVRLTLSPGSCVMETGGYKGQSRELTRTALHSLLAKTFGLPQRNIVCEYGMCELASQAYDHAAGVDAPRHFRFPHWARARIVSPETGRLADEGEPGLIEVVDLANVRSVLAVQTADVAVRRGEGFEWMGRAEHSEPRGCSLTASMA